MISDKIFIKGAREHNLKNVDLELPRDKLIVMTGLSRHRANPRWPSTPSMPRDSGAMWSPCRPMPGSSLGQMEKPDVDYIEGLSPAISIDQKTTSRNPRSTVGTVTEIHDYLRLMYARVGTPHCPKCGREIRQQTVDQIVDQVLRAARADEACRFSRRSSAGERASTQSCWSDMREAGLRPRAHRRRGVRTGGSADMLGQDEKAHHRGGRGPPDASRPDIQQRLTDSLETAMGCRRRAGDW